MTSAAGIRKYADMTALESDEYTAVVWGDKTYGELREAD